MTTTYSNSQLQTYKNCPLQWRFYWDLQLRRVDDEASDHHLRFGDAIHKGLEQLYRGATWSEIKEAFLSAYPRQLDVNDLAKTRENGVVALADYIKRWRQEDRKWRIIEIETRSDDPWSVKPDLIVENLESGGIYLVDHKTTGSYLNFRYWERYEPNSQITHYMDYAQSKYGWIEGFVINAIEFHYNKRASKDHGVGFWCNFERQTFNRKPEQLEDERVNRAAWIEDLERSCASGFFRTNTDQCWRCQYRPICQAGWSWERDAELIQIQYQQVCYVTLDNDLHCVLQLGHEGECAAVLPESLPFEVEVEV